MTSIKVKFRPSAVVGREGTIYYQIIHERKSRQLLSDYHIFPSEWDEKRSSVKVSFIQRREAYIQLVLERINFEVARIAKFARTFETDARAYTVDDLVARFRDYKERYTLFRYMDGIIVKLKQNSKIRTAETYIATTKSFKKFLESRGNTCHESDIMLEFLTSDILEEYEAWLRRRGNVANTISFYTRILRAVYNRAVEENIIEDRCPFRRVYTGIDKTVKRALPLPIIKQIKNLDLSPYPCLGYARDMFLLSFMLRGMSFVDMAYLRKTDRSNGYIVYRRRKTGQQLTIQWTKDMQNLLDKYPENESDYLLPIIKKRGTNERYTYRNVGYNINYNLKKIADLVGLPIPLTLYVARHSWASAAKAKGIPLSVISEGMGHDSENTTKIYLASLDTSPVDKANALILKSLK